MPPLRDKHVQQCKNGNSCCFCCCTERGATITLSIVGFIVSAIFLVPPVVIHIDSHSVSGNFTEGDNGINGSTVRYDRLFPMLGYTQDMLEYMIEHYEAENAETESIAESTMQKADTGQDSESIVLDPIYRSVKYDPTRKAIMSLIDAVQASAVYLVAVTFAIGLVNVPLHALLFVGSVFRRPNFILPWLIITAFQDVLLGIPLIAFYSVISLYLAAQLKQVLLAIAIISTLILMLILALSTWMTVHECYVLQKNRRALRRSASTDGSLSISPGDDQVLRCHRGEQEGGGKIESQQADKNCKAMYKVTAQKEKPAAINNSLHQTSNDCERPLLISEQTPPELPSAPPPRTPVLSYPRF